MHITIDETEYTALKNLEFAPEVDLTCDSLPINEFRVDIMTDDNITAGQEAELRDENDVLWAKYWIDYAERVNADTLHIRARSEISLLDGVTLEGTMYSNAALSDVLDDVMVRQSGAQGILAPIDYTMSSALSGAKVTGYCPEQTARERLQWVCFACGAYVKTAFVDEITVLPLDTTAALIPLNRTFWRPTVNHGEYVTAIKLTAYTFTQSQNAAASDSSYTFPLPWVASTQVFTLENNNVPAGINDNIVEIDELYLINQSNVSAIMTLLAARYFKRTEVQLDALDNGEYVPGDMVYAYANEESIYVGYIESASFKYGRQARASIKLIAADEATGAKLTVTYTYANGIIGQAEYYFPVGFTYSIANPFIDRTYQGRRYVYAPNSATITGTMTSGENTATQDYSVALEYHSGTLSVYAVDAVEAQSSGGSYTGVIS